MSRRHGELVRVLQIQVLPRHTANLFGVHTLHFLQAAHVVVQGHVFQNVPGGLGGAHGTALATRAAFDLAMRI